MSNYYIPSVDFDEQIVLSLCDSKRKPFMEIYNIQKFDRNISFASSDELSFEVPIYRDDPYGNKVRNELFDEIKEDLFILLNEDQYFVIKDCSVSKESGEDAVKSVEAFSYEYTLSNKIVEDYNLTSRLLWDVHNGKDENGFFIGFLNHVVDKTNWHVDYVSPKVLNKRRELKFSNRSILDCIIDTAETFNCIYQFDTINRGISVYDISEIGGNQGIVISDRNFIESLTQKINTSDLKTRLYMYGEDNLSFRDFNPTGKPYLDNMSFYREFGYLSKELCDSLDKYEKAVEEAKPSFMSGIKTYNEKITRYGKLYDAITMLKRDEKRELDAADNAFTSEKLGADGKKIEAKKHIDKAEKIKNERTAKEKEYDGIKVEIDNIRKELEAIIESLDGSKFFTEESMTEYNEFIKEDSKSDNSFVKGMEDQLLEYCGEIIGKIAFPSISFDIDLDSFRKISNFKNPMSRLKVGDMAYIECEELNVCAELRIISMKLNYDDHSAEISFGNKYKVNSSEMYLSELLSEVKSVSNTISLSDFYWNRNIEQYSAISRHLNDNLNLARQAIVTAEGQKPIMDDRGIWLFKQNPDGSIDNKQIRAVNNVIAFTNDNWKTVTTAITGDGINAEAVTGRLGNFVTLNANQIVVNDETDQSALADFVRANGGKTYRQSVPPDVDTSTKKVDTGIKIPDGALWLRTSESDGGRVFSIYRYNPKKTFAWGNISGYTGTNHWEEISDMVFKDKSYGGAKIGSDGLTTVTNGVSINKDGLTVSNRNNSIVVKTSVNSDGFKITKNAYGRGDEEVFSVNKDGVLSIRGGENGRDKIIVDSSGIRMPAMTSLKIGDVNNYSNYISIDTNGVQFGRNGYGFNYSTNSGTLTIGGYYGLRYENNQLYIGNQRVASASTVESLWTNLMELGRMINSQSQVPAYVRFG